MQLKYKYIVLEILLNKIKIAQDDILYYMQTFAHTNLFDPVADNIHAALFRQNSMNEHNRFEGIAERAENAEKQDESRRRISQHIFNVNEVT